MKRRRPRLAAVCVVALGATLLGFLVLPPWLRQRTLDGKLVSVCMRGDVAEVRRLLAIGASPDAAGEGEWTALTIAARDGHFEVVRCLIENGARLDGADVWGFTPLFWAAARGREEIAVYLLDHGANPKTHNRDHSVLTEAASRGHARLVALLLQRGADIHWRNAAGLGALGFAERGQHDEVARLLLESGAQPDNPSAIAKAPNVRVERYREANETRADESARRR